MRIKRYCLLLPLVFSLALLPYTLAETASSPKSAWTRTSLRPDPKLRDPLLRRGREVFDARCRSCHGAIPRDRDTGGLLVIPPMPGTQALQAKYKGKKPALLEQRTDLTPELIAVFVRHGSGAMPFFRPTEVSNADLKALGAYLSRNRKP